MAWYGNATAARLAGVCCDALRCDGRTVVCPAATSRPSRVAACRAALPPACNMPRCRPVATLATCRATLPPGCNAWQRVVPRFAARLQRLATCRTVAGSAPPPNDEPALPPRTLPPQPQQRGQPSAAADADASAAAGRYVSGAAEREGPAGSLGSLLAQQVRVGRHPFPVAFVPRGTEPRGIPANTAVVALRCNVAALRCNVARCKVAALWPARLMSVLRRAAPPQDFCVTTGNDRLRSLAGYGAGADFPWRPPQLPSAVHDRRAQLAPRHAASMRHGALARCGRRPDVAYHIRVQTGEGLARPICSPYCAYSAATRWLVQGAAHSPAPTRACTRSSSVSMPRRRSHATCSVQR